MVTERRHLGSFLTRGSGYEAGVGAEEGVPMFKQHCPTPTPTDTQLLSPQPP